MEKLTMELIEKIEKWLGNNKNRSASMERALFGNGSWRVWIYDADLQEGLTVTLENEKLDWTRVMLDVAVESRKNAYEKMVKMSESFVGENADGSVSN